MSYTCVFPAIGRLSTGFGSAFTGISDYSSSGVNVS